MISKKTRKMLLSLVITSMITPNILFTVNVSASGLSAKKSVIKVLPSISSIENISATVYQNDRCTLPSTVTATMSDGSTEEVAVKWNPSKIDTSKARTYTYTGKVNGYNGNVKLKMTVKALPSITSIANINVTVNQNDSYTLPSEVTAVMSDGTSKSVGVVWDKVADTSTVGTFTYIGTVSGYSSKVNLTLNVKALPITIASIADINATVNQNDKYTLPSTVQATMSDGTSKSVDVTWNKQVDTSEVGIFTYVGTVSEYSSKVTLTIKVEPTSYADITPPQVKGGEVSSKIFNVGDTITFKLNLQDDKSGVKSAYIALANPSESRNEFVYLKYDSILNLWVGSYTVKSIDEGGIYDKFFLSVTDSAGNQIYSWNLLDNYKSNLTFNINNSDADITPPQVKGGEVSSKIFNVGDTITFKLNLQDDKSGVKSAYIALANPSESRNEFVYLKYDSTLNSWVGSYTVKSTDEGGIYDKFFLSVTDSAGNQIYSWNLLDNYKSNLTFNINN